MSLRRVPLTTQPTVNVFLYGPPKSGKSMGAGSAPGPVLYLNADTSNAIRLVRTTYGDKIVEVIVDDLSTLTDVTNELQQHPDDWSTVVLDTVGDTHRRVIEGLSGRAIRPKINEYGDTSTYLERFARFLCEQPVNVVLVAHETIAKDEESGAFERLPWTGTTNPALGAKLMAMVDVIGYTGVLRSDDAPPRYMAQIINGNGRRGGDRFDVLGPARDVDLSDWFSAISAVASAKDKSTVD